MTQTKEQRPRGHEGAAASSTLNAEHTLAPPRYVRFTRAYFAPVMDTNEHGVDDYVDEIWSVVVRCPFCGADHRHAAYERRWLTALCGGGEYRLLGPSASAQFVAEEMPEIEEPFLW